MNDIDRRIIDAVVHDVPFSEADYRSLGEAGPIGQAALLIGTDETAIEAWYTGFRGEPTPISRLLARAVDRDEVADTIDQTLTRDPRVLEDLARASVTWTHDALPGLLDQSEYRVGAAWMLVQANPDVIRAWLQGTREAEAIVEVARVAGVLGCEELFEAFSDYVEPMQEAPEPQRNLLNSSLFLMSPNRWSRLFLRGDWSGDWLMDWVSVADVLSVQANSYFGGLLSLLWDDPESFELIARFAAGGLGASFATQPGDDLGPLLQALDAEDFDLLASHPAMKVAAALAEDDDLLIPTLEGAAHDLLFAHGEDSPGIAGFPLSPTYPAPEEIDVANELLQEATRDPDSYLAVVATLADLAMLAPTEPKLFAPLLESARALKGDARKPISRAAHRIFDREPAADLARVAVGEDIRAYGAAEQLGRMQSEEALLELIGLWAERGSVYRTSLYSALVFDELRRIAAT